MEKERDAAVKELVKANYRIKHLVEAVRVGDAKIASLQKK